MNFTGGFSAPFILLKPNTEIRIYVGIGTDELWIGRYFVDRVKQVEPSGQVNVTCRNYIGKQLADVIEKNSVKHDKQ